ncbi:MAG: SDR family NAD(P)-dependent oxidoreductase [Gammaproteobacteria bacterium]
MKKIIIAGSSSGIGKAITEKMLLENHQVIGLARHHHKFVPLNENYHTYTIDFSKIDILENQFKQIQADHSVIDAIICSVGYGEFKELEQFSVERMQAMLNVNFLSQAILIKTFLASLKTKKSGQVILIGSESALDGQKKGSMYCASKFALRGFSQSLRKECSSANVTVTLINPGFVDTPFFDELNFRPAQGESHAILPEQIASMVSLIVSENSNCVYEEINLQPLKKVLEKQSF